MLKKFTHIASAVLLLSAPCASHLFAREDANQPNEGLEITGITQAKVPTDEDMPKISEAFGHMIGKNLETLGINFDMQQVVKGIQESSSGKESPMTEQECIQAITMLQESLFQKQAQDNLAKAEEFLSTNAKGDGVVSLEEGKLQYREVQAGSGEIVESHFSPEIKYTGKFIDGKVFGASTENEVISFDETIPGLSKAIIGMKEGEKREVFIHPELGYGTQGYLPPNSLLSFEIEVVKANVPQQVDDSSLTSSTAEDAGDEIAITTPMGENDRAVR